MRRMKWMGLLLLLCGCASKVVLPPPQLPTTDFSVNAFPNGMYLIAYKGPTNVPSERVMDLALLKASQVAREQELKYFVIVDQAASRPGEVKFRRSLPGAGEWNNELLIQAFKGRPHRVFCYRAEATEKAIYEKFRSAAEAAL